MLRAAINKNMTVLKGRKMKITKSNENSTIFIGNIRKNWKNADIEAKVKRIVSLIYNGNFSSRTARK